jgi:hypothetical protein
MGARVLINENWYKLADFRDRCLRSRHAVAVNDQARAILLHQSGVELVREKAADRGDADIPGDVTLEFSRRNTEPTERARHKIASVIGNDKEGRSAVFVVHRDRRRFVGRQQLVRRLVHWCLKPWHQI